VQIKSAIGREFTLATNQVDFVQPGRFDLVYVDEHGERQTPLCIHRAPLSTHERMVGFLIEHYGGDFPLWLAPEQARVVPIADRHVSYAGEVVEALRAAGLRAEVDDGNERMNAKVRSAELYKVPYILIVGDQEEGARTVSFRSRKEDDRKGVALDAFARHLAEQAQSRTANVTPIA
jgi:threonyl-tRNA synthetase